ncbi:hypothetical protein J6590_017231 [Homalodisca vitripennis]|nr:hypothetical protein J6590_017231 [Homalodisca vitripennis]
MVRGSLPSPGSNGFIELCQCSSHFHYYKYSALQRNPIPDTEPSVLFDIVPLRRRLLNPLLVSVRKKEFVQCLGVYSMRFTSFLTAMSFVGICKKPNVIVYSAFVNSFLAAPLLNNNFQQFLQGKMLMIARPPQLLPGHNIQESIFLGIGSAYVKSYTALPYISIVLVFRLCLMLGVSRPSIHIRDRIANMSSLYTSFTVL